MSRRTIKALTGARAPSPAVRTRPATAKPRPDPTSTRQSPPQRFALGAISLYQHRLSPGLAPACRFQPTCSHYAYDAVERYGAIRGLVMAAWRILRCNPLNDGGFDPVPEPASDPKGASPA